MLTKDTKKINTVASISIDHIRNFCIIAHIDHGKSTLADRLIELYSNLEMRKMKPRFLDSMEMEQERNITIKAQTTRLVYIPSNLQDIEELGCAPSAQYILNLVDTPGHVDFGNEVSRSLAACEGSVLVIDATQGIEAQTLANVYKAIEHNHKIVLVLNKIDLPAADPNKVIEEIKTVIGLDTTNLVLISAKTGLNVENVARAIIKYISPPTTNVLIDYNEDNDNRDNDNKDNLNTNDKLIVPQTISIVNKNSITSKENLKNKNFDDIPLKAMLVDSWYDKYLGVVILVRVFDGIIRKGMTIKMIHAKATHTIETVGLFTPEKLNVVDLKAGEIGFITCSIKQLSDCNIGDTITDELNPCLEPLPGFKKPQPVVFCGLYPADSNNFHELKESLAKLYLNDSSFTFEMESSTALGFGFRCGFLGLLHLEIIQERLDREFNMDVVTTSPSVIYKLYMQSGTILEMHNPSDMPNPSQINHIEEPWIKATIILPDEFLGSILSLCTEKRGEQIELTYTGMRAMVVYRLPLNEIVYDFNDRLKSCSKGYASFDWEHDSYKKSDLVKVSILINAEPVDALSIMVHRSKAESRGRELCLRLKDLIPRHMFAIPIQAVIGGKIIARETISALRKDVTAKCYGGDVTRKRKLLEKQKEGKKKMRAIGKVNIPQSAFIAVLKVGDNNN